MNTAQRIRKAYREHRKPYVSNNRDDWTAGPTCGPFHTSASGALRLAKRDVLIARLERADLIRVKAVPDEFMEWDDMVGDCFSESNADTVPGGMRTIKAQESAYRRRLDSEGVWGFVGEYRLSPGSAWVEADSLWGCDDPSETSETALEVQSATIDSLVTALKSRCPVCRKAGAPC